MFWQKSARITSILTVALALAAVGSAGARTGGLAQGERRQLDAVSLRLGWVAKGEYAFIYAGIEKGIFKKYGIDLTLSEGRGSLLAMQLVASGSNHFGYTGGAPYYIARTQGMAIKMVAVMLQSDPQVLLSWPDDPVRRLNDIEGKSIILTPGDGFTPLWPTIAEARRIDRAKVKELSVGFDARAQLFLAKQATVLPAYITNEVYPLEEQTKTTFVKIRLANYGWGTLNNGLFTTEKMIAENPDLVRRMVAAMTASFNWAADNPRLAAAIMAPRLPGVPLPVVVRVVKATAKLAHTGLTQGRPLGWTHAKDWQRSLEIVSRGGVLKSSDIRPVEEYFTNAFIPRPKPKR